MASFITTDYVMGFAIGFCLVVLIALVARAAGPASRAAAGGQTATATSTTGSELNRGNHSNNQDQTP